MVYGTRLESGRTLIAFREFESLPLRHDDEGASPAARSFVLSAPQPASLGSLGVAGKRKPELVASTVNVTRPMWSGPKKVCE